MAAALLLCLGAHSQVLDLKGALILGRLGAPEQGHDCDLKKSKYSGSDKKRWYNFTVRDGPKVDLNIDGQIATSVVCDYVP